MRTEIYCLRTVTRFVLPINGPEELFDSLCNTLCGVGPLLRFFNYRISWVYFLLQMSSLPVTIPVLN